MAIAHHTPIVLDKLPTAHGGLAHRLQTVLAEAMGALGEGDLGEIDTVEDARSLSALALELVVERIEGATRGDPRELSRLGGLVLSLNDLLQELDAQARSDRLDALAKVRESLARLRALDSPARLVERCTREACRAGGFDRVVLFRVEENDLLLQSVHVEGTSARADELRRSVPGAGRRLNDGTPRAEAVRRRQTALVEDPVGEGRSAGALGGLLTRASWVLAPVESNGQAIGLLEADRLLESRRVDRLDRDALGAFAQGLGEALERAALLERLRAQRHSLLHLARSTEAVASELGEVEVRLARADELTSGVRPATAELMAPSESVADDLSVRELDVMDALATGASNAEIASRLHVSENTVKTHVKRIFGKLGAANRVEAVSRFLQLRDDARAVPREEGSHVH